jgi:glycosyltransferase involved in cell wall biosynthesis
VRVVHTIASLGTLTGGPARSVPGMADALAAEGVSVTLVALDHERVSGKARRPRDPKVDLRLAPAAETPLGVVPWSPAFGRLLAQALAVAGPCIAHDHGIWLPTNVLAARVARRAQVPFVVSPHGMLEPWSLGRRALKKRLAWHAYQRPLLRSAVAFHATSEDELRSLRTLGFGQPIAVIPHGVDAPPRPLARPTGETRTALFLGRLHPVKGIETLLRAWAALRPSGWRLIVAGPDQGGFGPRMRALSGALGLGGCVTFPGEVDDAGKWTLFERADLFVLPSHTENFGMVVGEALLAGLPVVTTEHTPWRWIESDSCGWCVAPRLEAITAALRDSTSRSPADLAAMGERGRQAAQQRCSWPIAARAMAAFYAWLLGRGRRPGCVVER